jgi:serine/threonine protein kinase
MFVVIFVLDVLIDKTGHIKLADFGTSTLCEDNQSPRTSFVGTQDYVSPEVLSGERKATRASDLWAVGVMIYQMLTGISPFRGPTEFLTFEAIMGHCKNLKPLQFPPSINESSRDLILNLLKSNESERIGSSEEEIGDNGYRKLKAHPFFESIEWYEMLQRIPPFIPDPTKFPDPNNMRDGAEDDWLLEGEATPIMHGLHQDDLMKKNDEDGEGVLSPANRMWNRFLFEGEGQIFNSTIYKRKVWLFLHFVCITFNVVLMFSTGFIF